MSVILVFLMGLAMLGVVGVLLAGIVGTARGADPWRSNRLMRWRVLLQGVALLLLALIMVLARRR
ncbi:MAG TPA: twin transmembrane helix small protein [Acetobacteraceae bacterium]|nr:twin transmembrane helix small protein [Acetobacteraceae bacterium]